MYVMQLEKQLLCLQNSLAYPNTASWVVEPSLETDGLQNKTKDSVSRFSLQILTRPETKSSLIRDNLRLIRTNFDAVSRADFWPNGVWILTRICSGSVQHRQNRPDLEARNRN